MGMGVREKLMVWRAGGLWVGARVGRGEYCYGWSDNVQCAPGRESWRVAIGTGPGAGLGYETGVRPTGVHSRAGSVRGGSMIMICARGRRPVALSARRAGAAVSVSSELGRVDVRLSLGLRCGRVEESCRWYGMGDAAGTGTWEGVDERVGRGGVGSRALGAGVTTGADA